MTNKQLLKIGTLVALEPYSGNKIQPIGIVVSHKEDIFNYVEWINGDEHSQDNGGYFKDSLKVLSEVK